MSNDNNIQSNQQGIASGTSGVGLRSYPLRRSDCAPAPCTGRCPSCGRTVEAGDLMLHLGDQFVHGCGGYLRFDAASTCPAGGSPFNGQNFASSDGSGEGGGEGREVSGSSASDRCCPSCYPNHMEVVDPPVMAAGHCRFSVRTPGFTLDVVATTMEEAGWAAEAAVHEHFPSETIEVRCAAPGGCGHPDEWVQAWTVT